MENMTDDMKWGKMAKSLAHETSQDEEAELELNVRTDDEWQADYNKAVETWSASTYAAQHQAIDHQAAFDKVKAHIDQNKKRRSALYAWMASAAAVVLFVAVGTAIWFGTSDQGPAAKILTAQAHTDVMTVTLHDGTNVALNSGSLLVYPQTFNAANRNVKLTGEAFFDVAPDKNAPFVIDAGNVTVKVLGTAFNVKSIDETGVVEVTVARGVVEVCGKTDKVRLTKDQKAVVDTRTGHLEKTINNNANYNAWLTRKLVFTETPLAKVFETLEDVYHLHFTAGNAKLLAHKLTATFDHQDADNVAQAVALTFNLKLEKGEAGFRFTE